MKEEERIKRGLMQRGKLRRRDRRLEGGRVGGAKGMADMGGGIRRVGGVEGTGTVRPDRNGTRSDGWLSCLIN